MDRPTNEVIVELASSGASTIQIARAVGLSRQRVHHQLTRFRRTGSLPSGLRTCAACGAAYQQNLGHERPVSTHFFALLDRSADCWTLKGAAPNRYTLVLVDGSAERRAHRLAWELANGPVPAGQFVLHRCDNPPCARPDHLFLGTAADNTADMRSKGRGGWQRN